MKIIMFSWLALKGNNCFVLSKHYLTNLKMLCSQAPDLLEFLFSKGWLFLFLFLFIVISTFSINTSNMHAII